LAHETSGSSRKYPRESAGKASSPDNSTMPKQSLYPDLTKYTVESGISKYTLESGVRDLKESDTSGTLQSSPDNSDYEQNISARMRHKTPAPTQITQGTTMLNQKGFWIIVMIVLVAVVLGCSFKKSNDGAQIQCDCSRLMDLQKDFPNQDKKLFKSLKTGVEATINGKPPEPTVFSIFSTDENVLHKVIDEIIGATLKCINQSGDPLSLNKDQLNDKMIDNYKEELVKRKILIINNVNDAPPSTVPALHSFCDTENPLVAKSIIFITMMVPDSPSGKPVEYIHTHLSERWASLADYIREPLIARLLDQTFFLKP
jgi:hypothetical protein